MLVSHEGKGTVELTNVNVVVSDIDSYGSGSGKLVNVVVIPLKVMAGVGRLKLMYRTKAVPTAEKLNACKVTSYVHTDSLGLGTIVYVCVSLVGSIVLVSTCLIVQSRRLYVVSLVVLVNTMFSPRPIDTTSGPGDTLLLLAVCVSHLE